MKLSIVIPAYNEAESLPELMKWIARACESFLPEMEVWVIDDGSTDTTWQTLQDLKATFPWLKALRLARNYGKSAALSLGFQRAQGEVVVTLDADLQDSPDEIPHLYQMIQEGYHLVSGYKKDRKDPLSKTLPSKLFNFVTRKLTGIPLHDFNSGIKAYQQRVVKALELYGEMHRYIPYLAKEAGFKRIGEKVVTHYPRKYGKTKFGIERFWNGFLDLLTLSFLIHFGRRPMHLFGLLGILAFLVGFGVTAYLIYEKLATLSSLGTVRREIYQQPLFYLGLTSVILGTQLFLAGFLGELILRHAPDRKIYLISQEL